MVGSGKQYFTEAIVLTKNGNYDKAISFYDKAINSVNSMYSLVSRINFTINEWEFYDDITFCEKNINGKCKNPNGYLALSLIFKIAKNDERRLKFLQQAIKLDKSNARIWRDYGETAFYLGHIKEAQTKFQEAIALDPQDSISFEGLGLCYYYLDEPIKAIKPLRKALQHNKKNHVIMNHLAFILSEVGEIEEAKGLITEALKLDSENHIYMDTYACILFLEEKYMESLEAFEKILAKKPNDIDISWDILSNLYDVLGMHAKAKSLETKLQL
ncbi:MAG: tetratricopeptide repeat protein [Candidatus Heimdallarchaeota archaeon]